MKKHLLSAAVLLGLASGASAVNLSDTGVGEVLLYPYYTVNQNKDTYITVVNTTNNYKAVKMRFNEGGNTWEVLDFNVYMSPYDVFSAAVTLDNGVPVVKSFDSTCVLNNIFANGASVPFKPSLINEFGANGSNSVEPSLFKDLTVEDRMREGHVEVIEMAEIADDKLKEYIEHVDGMPGDCAKLTNVVTSAGDLTTPSDQRIAYSTSYTADTTPTGGLYGNGQVIDVQNGSSIGYNATAIDDFLTGPVHTKPGTSLPNLNGDVSFDGTIPAQASLQADLVRKDVTSGKSFQYQVEYSKPVEALSATLAASSVYNNYVVTDLLQAATDWVVTFPTKHFFVNESTFNGTGTITGQRGFATGGVPVAPFTTGYCTKISVVAYDNEERAYSQDQFTSPSVGESLCYETNVLQFSSTRSVLDSKLKKGMTLPATFGSGWASITFDSSVSADGNIKASTDPNATAVFSQSGLPVNGFSFTEVRNNFLVDDASGGRVKANYGSGFEHRYSRTFTLK